MYIYIYVRIYMEATGVQMGPHPVVAVQVLHGRERRCMLLREVRTLEATACFYFNIVFLGLMVYLPLLLALLLSVLICHRFIY